MKIVVVTGGPGGGKSSFLADVRRDPELSKEIIILPEAIHAAARSSVRPSQAVFQRLVVNIQKNIEQAVVETFAGDDRFLLTHRGTLDTLAFCLAAGWTEERYWHITGLRLEDEYCRYHGIIHLVSIALGAPQFYRYRPEEHRPETPQEAAVLDEHLARIWGGHPRYVRIYNDTLDWAAKSRKAIAALRHLLAEEGQIH